jgi:hypothetical protein
VIDEFRAGRFDDVELASDVAETKFFQFLFGQEIVDQLARHYPSPRDRHHVPLWICLSSQLSLRLHGQHSFHSYPLVIRCGGLVDALGPDGKRPPLHLLRQGHQELNRPGRRRGVCCRMATGGAGTASKTSLSSRCWSTGN